MKLWHDDVRPPPEGWVWARTNEQAKNLFETEEIDECSLDHDLGYGGPPPGPCDECGGIGRWSEGGETWSCGACDGDGFIGGDVLYIAGTAEEDGRELARWMVETGNIPSKITIHSWNPIGAEAMAELLHETDRICEIEIAPYELPAAYHRPMGFPK